MPRYNVEADGLWACFSSVPDAFITPFMAEDAYQAWRLKEYGKSAGPLREANQMSLRDALFSLSLNKTDDQIMENMRAAGLFHELEDVTGGDGDNGE